MNYKMLLKLPIIKSIFSIGRLRDKLSASSDIDTSNTKHILVIQLGGIGDILLIFPLLEVLCTHYPNHRISTLTEHGWLFEIFKFNSILYKNHTLNMSGNYMSKVLHINSIKKTNIDMAICASRGDGMAESSIISMLCGADIRIGFGWQGSKLFYTHTIDFITSLPVWEQNMKILKFLNIHADPYIPTLSIPSSVEESVIDNISNINPENKRIILFHPWAGNFSDLKKWPTDNYASLARLLIKKYNCLVCILGGEGDMADGEKLASSANLPSFINLGGKYSFIETTALIKNADLFVGNDSALLHVAGYVGTPSVGIFGATSAHQLFQPDDTMRTVSIEVDCGPCYLHQPMTSHSCEYSVKCLNDIAVDQVLAAIHELTPGRIERPVS